MPKIKSDTLKYLFNHALSRELFKEKLYNKTGIDLSKYIPLKKDDDVINNENYKLNVVLLNENKVVVLCENNKRDKKVADDYISRIKKSGILLNNTYIKDLKITKLIFSR